MSTEALVLCIGLSHLLQPPLALLLTRRLALASALAQSPPLLGQLLRNMAVASVVLPTALGVLLARHADEIASVGPTRSLAWLLAAFWSWRLLRQCAAREVWKHDDSGGKLLHALLTSIFLAQGPGLGLLLVLE